MTDADVELVLVDDGSNDGTIDHLHEQQREMRCHCTVVAQNNRGPGGSRNTGFKHASGKYVWFIDADDDFNPSAIAVVRRLQHAEYDFIDFGIQRFEDPTGRVRPSIGARVGELRVPPGEHRIEEVTRLYLLSHIGWLVTKVFRRDFITGNALAYPEYCVSEDGYLFFVLPFLVRRFYKSDVVGYHHHQDRESISRSVGGRKGPRFYDRLAVTAASLDKAIGFDVDAAETGRLISKFNNIFLFDTLKMMLRESGDWFMAPRVMRLYREEVRARGLSPFRTRELRWRVGWSSLGLWLLSYLYPSQRRFFEQLHLQAWGHPIIYPNQGARARHFDDENRGR